MFDSEHTSATPRRMFSCVEYADDILIWPEGFWCYRSELADVTERDGPYRVVARSSIEWKAYASERAHGSEYTEH